MAASIAYDEPAAPPDRLASAHARMRCSALHAPRVPADNLSSLESNSPFARTRVEGERVAREETAAVGGTHAALVYLAAEGRAGGYDLRWPLCVLAVLRFGRRPSATVPKSL